MSCKQEAELSFEFEYKEAELKWIEINSLYAIPIQIPIPFGSNFTSWIEREIMAQFSFLQKPWFILNWAQQSSWMIRAPEACAETLS